MYDAQGKRDIDGSGGPLLCTLGHGLDDMADALRAQAKPASYVFRFDFTTPQLEEACSKICAATNGEMDRVSMVSGGSEANESAIKLARRYHVDNGNASKSKIISRWLSFHGFTTGSLGLSGFPGRRADYVPYINGNIHIAPAYCYRCWYNQAPESCDLACAQALETEIMCQGPETVAGFMAAVVASKTIDYIREHDLVPRVHEMGAYLA